jgi:AraC family transcriptional regulator
MTLHIKNMVCDRCIMVVRQQLENQNFLVSGISLGTAEVYPDPEEEQLQKIAAELKLLGFELIDKEKDKLTERIKNVVIELVHHSDLSELHQNLLTVIADRLNKDYAYLSRLFSDAEDITIEKFVIQQKIEKVKELLEYGELNISEIAYKMGYSSIAHLSAQFKNITGLTPRQFKASEHVQRKAIDKI